MKLRVRTLITLVIILISIVFVQKLSRKVLV